MKTFGVLIMVASLTLVPPVFAESVNGCRNAESTTNTPTYYHHVKDTCEIVTTTPSTASSTSESSDGACVMHTTHYEYEAVNTGAGGWKTTKNIYYEQDLACA